MTFTFRETFRYAIELFASFIRQPIMVPLSPCIIVSVSLAGIIIPSKYEFYLISDLVAPPMFREFTNIKELVDSQYIIGYHGQLDAAYRDEMIGRFESQGIRHDINKTIIDLSPCSYDDSINKLSSSVPKLAVDFGTYSVKFGLTLIKSQVYAFDCYSLRLNSSKFAFHYTKISLLDEFQSFNRKYYEAGFMEVWLKWNMFRLDLVGFKNPQKEHLEHLSFTNLSSFFIIYVMLLTICVFQMLLEIRTKLFDVNNVQKLMIKQ